MCPTSSRLPDAVRRPYSAPSRTGHKPLHHPAEAPSRPPPTSWMPNGTIWLNGFGSPQKPLRSTSTASKNIWLAGEVDRLNREIDERIKSDGDHIAKLKKVADDAIDNSVGLRSKVELVAEALEMILRPPQAASSRRPRSSTRSRSSRNTNHRQSRLRRRPDWRPNRDITGSRVADPPTDLDRRQRKARLIPQNSYR